MKFNHSGSVAIFSLLLLSILSLSDANAQSSYIPPTLPSIPEKTFSINDYGAAGNNRPLS